MNKWINRQDLLLARGQPCLKIGRELTGVPHWNSSNFCQADSGNQISPILPDRTSWEKKMVEACLECLGLNSVTAVRIIMPVAYFWSFGREQFRSLTGRTVWDRSRCKSFGEKSLPSWTGLNGRDCVVFSLATGGELDASLRWSGHTQMGTFQGNKSQEIRSVSDL